jgi:hypothetical protein
MKKLSIPKDLIHSSMSLLKRQDYDVVFSKWKTWSLQHIRVRNRIPPRKLLCLDSNSRVVKKLFDPVSRNLVQKLKHCRSGSEISRSAEHYDQVFNLFKTFRLCNSWRFLKDGIIVSQMQLGHLTQKVLERPLPPIKLLPIELPILENARERLLQISIFAKHIHIQESKNEITSEGSFFFFFLS